MENIEQENQIGNGEIKIPRNSLYEFVKWLEVNNYSYNTTSLYGKYISRLLKSDQRKTIISIRKIKSFLEKKVNVRYICTIKKFIDFLADRYEIIISGFRYTRTSSSRKETSPLTRDEIKLIINAMPDDSLFYRFKLITEVLANTGMRISEPISLKIENIDFSSWSRDKSKPGKIKLKDTKYNVERSIPISSSLMTKLAAQCEDKDNPGYSRPKDKFVFDFGYSITIKRYMKAKQKSIKDPSVFCYDEDIWDLKYIEKSVSYYRKIMSKVSFKVLGKRVHAHVLRHCVSENTEILTIDGWKKRNHLRTGEMCPTFNIEKDVIEFKPIKKIFSYDYNGSIFEIKNRYIQSKLTPEHNCLLKIGYAKYKRIKNKRKTLTKWNNWELKTIKNLFNEKNVRLIKGKSSGISDGFISIGKSKSGILGWILTDANININKSSVTIHQSLTANPNKCKIIEKLLEDSKIKYSKKIYIQKKEHGFLDTETKNVVFRIFKESQDWIFEWINKDRTPKWKLLQLKKEELKAIYTNMMLGDGTRGIELCNQNKKTIDFFRAMCSLLNYRTVLGTKRQNGKEYFRTYISKKNDFQISFKDIKKVYYKGKVWCPNIENNTWIARDNERIFITGNSYASYLDSKGVRPSIIQRLLGHKSLATTSIYLHPTQKEMDVGIIDD